MQPLIGYSIGGVGGGCGQDKEQNWNNKKIWAETIY